MPYIVIDETRCKGCCLCTIACPKKLISLSETTNNFGVTFATFLGAENCTGCSLCAVMCPDVAISVFKE